MTQSCNVDKCEATDGSTHAAIMYALDFLGRCLDGAGHNQSVTKKKTKRSMYKQDKKVQKTWQDQKTTLKETQDSQLLL